MRQVLSSTEHATRQGEANSIGALTLDVFIWICVLLTVLTIFVRTGFDSTLGQDSFQYLSVARNALDGRLGQTSLVHFDAERSFGVVPAPMVTFPPGYAYAIAFAGLTGLPLAKAGLLISVASMIACVPMLAWVTHALGLSRAARNMVVAAFVTNAAVIQMATKVASDALFTGLALFGICIFVHARRSRGETPLWVWLCLGITFGMAYAVRYAALFFMVGLTLVAIRHLLQSNRELASRIAIATAVAGVAAIAGIARNLALVGNWRGGNDKPVSNPIISVLLETVRGVNRLLLGPGSGVEGGTTVARAALVALVVAGLGWLVQRQMRSGAMRQQAHTNASTVDIVLDMMILAVTYLACLFYAGLKSVIDYGDPRYIAPLLPMILLVVSVGAQKLFDGVSRSAIRWPVLAFVASLGIYIYLNLLILQAPPKPGWLPIATALDAKSTDGRTARDVAHDIVASDGVIVANGGQIMGHLLARRTISLVGTHFSTIEWGEHSVRDVARQFKATAIVIYAPSSKEEWSDGGLIPSAFVRQLARGDHPAWLHLRYRSENLFVYEPRLDPP